MAQQLEKKFGIERFKTLGATKFSETTKSKEAKKDIKEVRKVDLVVFLLQEEVEDWQTLEENGRGRVNYENLKEIFIGKYFFETYRDEKRDGFLNLEEGELSITRHEKKFTELSKYAR